MASRMDSLENQLNQTTASERTILKCLIHAKKVIEDSHDVSVTTTSRPASGLISQGNSSDIKCHLFSSKDNKDDIRRSQLLMRFMMHLTLDEIDRDRFYGIFITAFSSIFKFVSTLSFREYLKSTGLTLIDVPYNDFEYYCLQEDDDIRDQWDDFVIESSDSKSLGLIAMGVMLCGTGRVLNNDNYEEWDKRRFASFVAKLHGIKDGRGNELHMSVSSSEILNIFLDSSEQTRGYIFSELESTTNGAIGAMFKIVLLNIQWYQLTNLLLITEIIVKSNPYIMLWGEVATMMIDYEIIMSRYVQYGKRFKYIKYLNPSIPASTFNTANVRRLATIAREIAVKRGQSSYSNFKIGDTPQVISDKLKVLIDLASNANFKWADFVRDNILPIKTNKDFYDALYTSVDAVTADNMIITHD